MATTMDRQQLRRMYFDTWQKYQTGVQLDGLEQQVAQVILEHPEYHDLLSNTSSQEAEFHPELGASNPFLHMGLHLSLREQVATNRPAGIAECYQQLLTKMGDHLEVEHQMLEVLAEALWQAQRDGKAPDEEEYLRKLRGLVEARS